MTSQPTNESELQLYRVLQRANLLNYYDTFISQGKNQTSYDPSEHLEKVREPAKANGWMDSPYQIAK
jgi:hypothetical protein